MQIQTKRNEPFQEVRRLIIKVGSIEYRITENANEGITVNKSEDGSSDKIGIYPSAVNEITIK